jgi:hypothetical protein
VYIGILLGARPILHISRIKDKTEIRETQNPVKLVRLFPQAAKLHEPQIAVKETETSECVLFVTTHCSRLCAYYY